MYMYKCLKIYTVYTLDVALCSTDRRDAVAQLRQPDMHHPQHATICVAQLIAMKCIVYVMTK